ncbi:MAG: hypothetical protein H7Z40_06570 [Phycisphaerae bacterium]|nr:hypothetical protein [Gemmatimonadaceae bacterium]
MIVNNASPQWDLSARWRVDTVPITRVGHDENEIESQFKSIWGATRLSNGNIVVSADNDVRMFGPDGKFIKTVARRGNGPGEFPSGGRLLRLPGDSILVWHEVAEGGRKIAIFGSDGSFIREERPDGDALRKLGPWSECHSMVFRDRSWLGCKKDSTIPATATNRASKLLAKGYSSPGPGHLRQFERRHLIPATLDTTHRIGIEGGIEQFGVALKGGGETFIQHPYYSRSLIASGGAPLRIATITNPAYNSEMWTPDGRLERIIRRANGRRIPSAEEKAELPALLRQWNDRRDADEATLAQMPTPDSLPAATGLLVGADGHIVVGREGTLPPYRRATFDIFNPDGYWLGELELPGRTYIMELGTDYILALHRNEDDVPVLGVFPLHRGSTKNSASAQATTR